jgi:hypothetical protein
MSKKNANEKSQENDPQKGTATLDVKNDQHRAKRGAELTKEIQESKELGETYRAGHQGKDILKEKIKHDVPNGHAEVNDDKLEQEFDRDELH